jgi:GMP reductase
MFNELILYKENVCNEYRLMIIETETKLDFNDVLIRPKRSTLTSRSEVTLERDITFKHVPDYTWRGVPIMVSNMDTTGTFEMAHALSQYNVFTCIHKYYTLNDWNLFCDPLSSDTIFDYISVTSGIGNEDLEKLYSIVDSIPVKFISLDVANGYTERFASVVSEVRRRYPNKVIIAGTVVTREMTEELIMRGADIVRVGIGGGSVCTTRKKTGVGYPQLSAVMECADAAHGLNAHIISDGGCTCPGDFGKAFGGGADFVMAGGMFSGHDESGGDIVIKGENTFKEFYGMSSSTAMEKYSGGVANYRTSEGKRVLIPYKGKVSDTIRDILGGLRSTCTYVGAPYLKNLSKCTTFIRVNRQLNTVYN